MRYEFSCKQHGAFVVEQSIFAEHKASCPECGMDAQRIYSPLPHIWDGNVFRPDGSYREDKDYAPVMRG